MPEIAKRTSSIPSMCSTDPPLSDQPRGIAGEALGACDQLYLHVDGTYRKATGAAANAAARVRGQARFPADIGEAVTVTKGLRYEYSDVVLTKGADVFLSGTVPGGLADAPSPGGTTPIGYVLEDGKRIEFFKPN